MSGEKKKGRRAYLNAFRKDAQGNYVYTGDLYYFQGEEASYKRSLRLLWACFSGMLVFSAIAASVPAPGALNCIYVLLPCMISFIGSISVGFGVYRLHTGKNPLKEHDYQASVLKIPGRAVCAGIGAAAAVVGEIVYVVRHGFEENMAGGVFFLLLEGAAAAAAVCIFRRMKDMAWKKA